MLSMPVLDFGQRQLLRRPLPGPSQKHILYTRLEQELALCSSAPVFGFGQEVPESGLRAAAGQCACGRCKDLGDVKTLGGVKSLTITEHCTSPSPTEI